MADLTTILIPIYDGVTQLDFTGPHQFLVRTPDTQIIVASVAGKPITSHGLVFAELADLAKVEHCDVQR
ncbi:MULTISPECIES: hypothetical protein [unclassified Sphingomonas]|uniref:hypothetical protein n=1 Tax=unclassified Sphingomonas TaxID=196159 RepID=UPI00226AF15D|nr:MULTISPECIES: hypothetical protein [unclassified Sphingomonas]